MFALLLLAMGLIVANAAEAVVGDKGPVGNKGPVGDKGPIGNKGPAGNVGATGLTGLKGSGGGAKGDKGIPGTNGAKGDKGIPGTNGAKGDKGIPGTNGTNGDKGLTGDVGDKGPIGDKGLTGDVGDKGLTGPGGGAKGDKGDAGTQIANGTYTGDTLVWNGNAWTPVTKPSTGFVLLDASGVVIGDYDFGGSYAIQFIINYELLMRDLQNSKIFLHLLLNLQHILQLPIVLVLHTMKR
jgi:hypothetical protein